MKRSDIPDRMVVSAAMAWRTMRKASTGDLLVAHYDAPPKVVLRAIERAIGRGLVECGVGPWWAWPTEKGLELLALGNRPRRSAPETPATSV